MTTVVITGNAAVISDGDPLRDLHPLFDLPADPAPAPAGARRVPRDPGCGGAGVAVAAGAGRVVAAVDA